MKNNENSVLILEFIKNNQLDIKLWNSSKANRLELIRLYKVRNELFTKKNNSKCDLFTRILNSLKNIQNEYITLFSFTFVSGKLAFGFIDKDKIIFYSGELG